MRACECAYKLISITRPSRLDSLRERIYPFTDRFDRERVIQYIGTCTYAPPSTSPSDRGLQTADIFEFWWKKKMKKIQTQSTQIETSYVKPTKWCFTNTKKRDRVSGNPNDFFGDEIKPRRRDTARSADPTTPQTPANNNNNNNTVWCQSTGRVAVSPDSFDILIIRCSLRNRVPVTRVLLFIMSPARRYSSYCVYVLFTCGFSSSSSNYKSRDAPVRQDGAQRRVWIISRKRRNGKQILSGVFVFADIKHDESERIPDVYKPTAETQTSNALSFFVSKIISTNIINNYTVLSRHKIF